MVEQPVAEAVTGLDQVGPRLRPAPAVDPQTTVFLEAAHGGLGARPIGTVFLGPAVEPQPGQSPLEVANRLAGRSLRQGQAELVGVALLYRNASIS